MPTVCHLPSPRGPVERLPLSCTPPGPPNPRDHSSSWPSVGHLQLPLHPQKLGAVEEPGRMATKPLSYSLAHGRAHVFPSILCSQSHAKFSNGRWTERGTPVPSPAHENLLSHPPLCLFLHMLAGWRVPWWPSIPQGIRVPPDGTESHPSIRQDHDLNER